MKNATSNFVGLPSRKQRRQDARENGTKFQPQYNGLEPERVQHKDALKNQVNAEIYAGKVKQRKRKTS